jgi:hypothetical protein
VAGDGDDLDYLQKMIVLRRDLKVVINTAYSEFKQDFPCWGADRFVIKSSDPSALETTVKKLLKVSIMLSALKNWPFRRFL